MSGQSIVKATPVPSALAEVGVRIGLDQDSGMQIVVIPPQVRERANVLDPVSSFAQADPSWTPAIRLVQLSADLHSYPIQGKRGLNKQGLELLARAGGILYSRVDRVKRDELADDEPWAYRATIGVRRSDGTIDEVTRERSAGEDGADTKFGREKTQSKAVLRAIRAALQIPHAFTQADFAKPFLVIGYSFTPDLQDAETRRMLVQVGLNAQAAIYGPGAQETPALPAGTDTAHTSADEMAASPPEGAERVGAAQQAAAADISPAAAAPGSDELEQEPSLADDDDFSFEAPASAGVDEDPNVAAARAASQYQIPNGDHKGLSLAEVHAKGDKGARWLKYALARPDAPPGYREAVWAFCRVYAPELYQAALAAQEAAA